MVYTSCRKTVYLDVSISFVHVVVHIFYSPLIFPLNLNSRRPALKVFRTDTEATPAAVDAGASQSRVLTGTRECEAGSLGVTPDFRG